MTEPVPASPDDLDPADPTAPSSEDDDVEGHGMVPSSETAESADGDTGQDGPDFLA